jgi:hypothetical protein
VMVHAAYRTESSSWETRTLMMCDRGFKTVIGVG